MSQIANNSIKLCFANTVIFLLWHIGLIFELQLTETQTNSFFGKYSENKTLSNQCKSFRNNFGVVRVSNYLKRRLTSYCNVHQAVFTLNDIKPFVDRLIFIKIIKIQTHLFSSVQSPTIGSYL